MSKQLGCQYTVGELATMVRGEVVGDADFSVRSVATLQAAESHSITFFHNNLMEFLTKTHAGVVLVEAALVGHCPHHAIVVDSPRLAFAQLLRKFFPPIKKPTGVAKTAVVAESCEMSGNVTIMPGCVVGEGCRLEDGVVLKSGCVLEDGVQIDADTEIGSNVMLYAGVRIGARCVIHAGAVIGKAGFGFERDAAHVWQVFPQIGGVVIGDDVEIGSNTTIDRGTMSDTVIGDGVKCDNLVQIGHNVRIGAHALICGCVGISGSSTIGRYCILAGGVGIADHVTLADHVVIAGGRSRQARY